jgi:molybdate transport system permease protein
VINASYLLGYAELETAWRVILPLAAKGILAGTMLAFARAIGEFGATLMLAGNIPGRTSTMPLAIYALASSGDWAAANLMAVALTVLSGAVLYLANTCSKRVKI